jgi:hypothetical protein
MKRAMVQALFSAAVVISLGWPGFAQTSAKKVTVTLMRWPYT